MLHFKNLILWLFPLLAFLLGGRVWAATALGAPVAVASPAVAFYYDANPPWDELQAFDIVVVDPDHVPDPQAPGLKHTRLAAYVALGEVQPSRPYASKIPPAWLRGDNKDWGSRLIDQAQPAWPQFFTDQIIAPLWEQGYRTFFLDTLDSYHLFSKTPQARAQQEDGMVAALTALKRRYPEARLIFNRGFEILERTHSQVDAVVAESLFQGYDAGKATYTTVSEADRAWLLGQLQQVRERYRLPVVAIDYVPSSDRALARETAQRIQALNFIPWVATPDLGSLGVGAIEVMPRKILVVHSPLQDEYELSVIDSARLLSAPVNYLGYVPEFVDALHLPSFALTGRYAGVVVWLTKNTSAEERKKLQPWLARQVQEKLPFALVTPSTALLDSLAPTLGLALKYPATSKAPVDVVQRDGLMGFEWAPRPEPDSFYSLLPSAGRPLLTLQRGDVQQVAAALTPWGGYVLDPYWVITLPGNNGNRWVTDPFKFLQQALRLPDMPVPDVSTQTGRRMLMVHMDGDGFVSRSELPGNPMAGEVVRDRVVKKYPLPMTISVIEAEISPKGLYPGLSASAEKIAQDIFREPHVAIASHSYSHPFFWRKAGGVEGDGEGYNLRLPGYRFDLQREMEGSIRYIEDRLAPPGKKVDMFFWTGDCVPGSDALQWTRKLGVLNMNGGDTVATRSTPTVTEVAGLGLPRDGGYQVYAPNQNENVYTNNWTGPFYGFERVIETFEFTEAPRRLKPINIYFHTYLTTKHAGMRSLDKVFAYAMAQETAPVFVSDYARQVLDFQTLAVARTPSGWRVRGAGQLRNLRLPLALGFPDLQSSRAVAGYRAGKTDSYVHLSGDSAELSLRTVESDGMRLVSANARVESAEPTVDGMRWNLMGRVPLQFTLAHADSCRVRVGGVDLKPTRRVGQLAYYQIKDHAARPLEAICRN